MVKPYIQLLDDAKANYKFHLIDSAGHNLQWYPLLEDSIKDFRNGNIRNTYPDYLIWQTDNPEKFNRNHWVVINGLGNVDEESKFEDINIDDDQIVKAFPRQKESGIIEVKKTGNVISVKTEGIEQYILLLSPEHINFNDPIKILTNGILSFEGTVSKSVEVVLKWAATDFDPKMLFGAELEIEVGEDFEP